MRHSEKQAEIAAALVEALAALQNPPRTATNPFFKSKYAPLHATLDLVRSALARHGLAVMQSAESHDGLPGVVTRIVHTSGEWIESEPLLLKPQKDDPQGYGGSVTYARRYSIEALLGICGDEDDDANYASTKKPAAAKKPAGASPSRPAHAPGGTPPSPSGATGQAPNCPECGALMRLRTAKTGKNAGGQFWGCPTKNDDGEWCNTIVSLEEAAGAAEPPSSYPSGFGPQTPLPEGYKYSGDMLCEVPTSYLERMAEKGHGKQRQIACAELARRDEQGVTIADYDPGEIDDDDDGLGGIPF